MKFYSSYLKILKLANEFKDDDVNAERIYEIAFESLMIYGLAKSDGNGYYVIEDGNQTYRLRKNNVSTQEYIPEPSVEEVVESAVEETIELVEESDAEEETIIEEPAQEPNMEEVVESTTEEAFEIEEETTVTEEDGDGEIPLVPNFEEDELPITEDDSDGNPFGEFPAQDDPFGDGNGDPFGGENVGDDSFSPEDPLELESPEFNDELPTEEENEILDSEDSNDEVVETENEDVDTADGVSETTAGFEEQLYLHKNDFSYSATSILNKKNNKGAVFQVAPVNINNPKGQSLVNAKLSDGINQIFITDTSGQLSIDDGDVTYVISANLDEDGLFKASVEVDSDIFNKKDFETRYADRKGRSGHLVALDETGISVHVVPTRTSNNNFGVANYMYAIIRNDNKVIHSALVENKHVEIFKIDDVEYEMIVKWDDESILYFNIEEIM